MIETIEIDGTDVDLGDLANVVERGPVTLDTVWEAHCALIAAEQFDGSGEAWNLREDAWQTADGTVSGPRIWTQFEMLVVGPPVDPADAGRPFVNVWVTRDEAELAAAAEAVTEWLAENPDPMRAPGATYCASCGRAPLRAGESHDCTREYADD